MSPCTSCLFCDHLCTLCSKRALFCRSQGGHIDFVPLQSRQPWPRCSLCGKNWTPLFDRRRINGVYQDPGSSSHLVLLFGDNGASGSLLYHQHNARVSGSQDLMLNPLSTLTCATTDNSYGDALCALSRNLFTIQAATHGDYDFATLDQYELTDTWRSIKAGSAMLHTALVGFRRRHVGMQRVD